MAQKGKRGFASMDRDKQRRIASMGGRAAHQKGTAHEFTSEEAREAGRKGGQAALEKRKAQASTAGAARQASRERDVGFEDRGQLLTLAEEERTAQEEPPESAHERELEEVELAHEREHEEVAY